MRFISAALIIVHEPARLTEAFGPAAGPMRTAIIRRVTSAILGGILSASAARAQEAVVPISKIQDNSFLVEEAYNQEEGVVQHINTFQRFRGGSWAATFTQEWPVPRQAHQLSYTILYTHVTGGDIAATGIGDVLLNYRYQLAGSSEAKFACAPRLSAILPSGNALRGLGSGSVGAQVNVAASTVLSEKFAAHTNLGGTWLPIAENTRGERAGTAAWNAGQSLIWTALPTFNLMLEAIYAHGQEVESPRRVHGVETALISPGIRWAWNFDSGLQIVPGIAAPIGVGPSRSQRGVFLYLSFEHRMWKPRS
jgi:hypothetical protein